jgi:putative FmdB family regulatory protein
MPIYEYVCCECSHRFETLQQGASRASCPSCRSERLDKQVSVFAVSTKGSAPARRESAAPCGTCGDPRGAGACGMS